MSMVGARIAVAGQLHHGSGGRLRDGVVRSSAPVPMGQCGGTVPAVSREETLGVAFAHSHDLGGLRDGKLVFQNTVEYLNPCLFLLVQRYIPHRDDMFADQLAGDRIVDHQQSLYETFPPAEARLIAKRLEFHHTPKQGSWLNMAEIEFSVLARACLWGRNPDEDSLEQAVNT